MRRLLKVKRLDHGSEVPIHDHLEELRDRLIISIVTLGVALVVAFWRRHDVLDLLNEPLKGVLVSERPITLSPTEPLKIAVLVSLWTAIVATIPVLFYQAYAFVVPAFEDEHQKAARPLIIGVPLLFLVGVVFAYLAMLPAATKFLLGFDSDQYNTQVRAGDYYTYCVMLMLGMGILFELPAAVWLLTKVGAISSAFLRKQRRYALLVLAIVAAALPGGDPVSMMLGLIPLIILYEISIVLAKAVEKARPEPYTEPAPEA